VPDPLSLRAVRVIDLDDGMSELRAPLPSVLAQGILDRLTRMGREVADAEEQTIRDAKVTAREAERDADRLAKLIEVDGADTDLPMSPDAEPACRAQADAARERARTARAHAGHLVATRRSLDEIRADILADLLLASDPQGHVGRTKTGLGAIAASVQVTVPVLSLLDSPVDDPFDAITLTGYGPVDPATARELAAGAPGWDRILTHPISSAVLAVDRYKPTKKMRRHLAVRDQHCRFPGCRQPTARSDVDHTIDHALGGPTEHTNLAHLCRRHHVLKHHSTWSVKQRSGGVLEWTSPTGRCYPDHSAAGVHFATDAEFDPAPF
jgi:hypothetical protein